MHKAFIAAAVTVALVGRASSQSPAWGQCGGIGFTGPTTCVPDWTCEYFNPYFSWCLQPDSTTTTDAAPTSTAV